MYNFRRKLHKMKKKNWTQIGARVRSPLPRFRYCCQLIGGELRNVCHSFPDTVSAVQRQTNEITEKVYYRPQQ